MQPKDNWTQKYAPQKISEIIGNSKAIQSIVGWLNTFNVNKKNFLEELKKIKIKNKKTNKKTKYTKKRISKLVNHDDIDESKDDQINEDNEEEFDTELQTTTTNKKNVPYSNLLILGNHGVGKTCAIRTILNEMGYNIKTINFNKVQKIENIPEMINKIIDKRDILSTIENNTKQFPVLLVDNLESISSKPEMSLIIALLEHNNTHWNFPFIFVSNNKHTKFIHDVKKKSFEITFWQPYPDNMITVLNNVSNKENIKYQNHNVINKIVEHAQQDYRRLIFILQDIKYIYENTIITENIMEQYCELSKTKDQDFDLFKAAANIVNKYCGIDNTIRYYEVDKVNLPLMMQENYVRTINKFSDDNKALSTAKDIANSLSVGDVIENYIYGNQNWNIIEVHGFYSCANPSYLLEQNLNKEPFLLEKRGKHGEVIFDEAYARDLKLEYPNDLNRTSIKRINKKNIIKVNEYFKNMNITDYVYINQIVRNLIENGKYKEFGELFKGYNFTIDNIDKILKVDKIKATKINLTTKQKKDLSKNLV